MRVLTFDLMRGVDVKRCQRSRERTDGRKNHDEASPHREVFAHARNAGTTDT